MRLVDRWEGLRQEHRLVESIENDGWHKATIKFKSGCSCGESYPVISVIGTEMRNSSHLAKYLEAHMRSEHLKHLVSVLLETEGQAEDVEDPTTV